MYETPEDLERLQGLLDRTYASGGAHLLDIHTPEVRLDAAAVVDRLVGMQVLVVATVNAAGWDEWTGPSTAWAIEADRMLAADMSARATT